MLLKSSDQRKSGTIEPQRKHKNTRTHKRKNRTTPYNTAHTQTPSPPSLEGIRSTVYSQGTPMHFALNEGARTIGATGPYEGSNCISLSVLHCFYGIICTHRQCQTVEPMNEASHTCNVPKVPQQDSWRQEMTSPNPHAVRSMHRILTMHNVAQVT